MNKRTINPEDYPDPTRYSAVCEWRFDHAQMINRTDCGSKEIDWHQHWLRCPNCGRLLRHVGGRQTVVSETVK